MTVLCVNMCNPILCCVLIETVRFPLSNKGLTRLQQKGLHEPLLKILTLNSDVGNMLVLSVFQGTFSPNPLLITFERSFRVCRVCQADQPRAHPATRCKSSMSAISHARLSSCMCLPRVTEADGHLGTRVLPGATFGCLGKERCAR